MALAANFPVGMAPGMGLNAFFAFTVVGPLACRGSRHWLRCSSQAWCSWCCR